MTSILDNLMNPPGQQDAFTQRMRDEFEFFGAKRLADGTYVGLKRLAFTTAICIGTDEYTPQKRRYCYESGNFTQCIEEFAKLTTGDDTPEGWIARRPKPPSDDEYRP